MDPEKLSEIEGLEDQKINPTIVNESGEYSGWHENINENELDYINGKEPDKNIVAYVSDIWVSKEG